MATKSNGRNERIKKSEERQSKITKEEGVMLKGNFEQRRSDWGREENKACCFECGYTDRFKALCPVWVADKEEDGKFTGISQYQKMARGKVKVKERKKQNLQIPLA